MRIAVDTNVLLAAFVARGLCAELLALLLQRHLSGRDTVFVSGVVKAEFRRHLKGKFKAAPVEIGEALGVLASFETGEAVVQVADGTIPDSDDVSIVAAALAFGADSFVTGDKALLGVGRVAGMVLLSPRQLFEHLLAHPA